MRRNSASACDNVKGELYFARMTNKTRPPKARHSAGIEERIFQALLLAADHLLQGEIEVLKQEDLTFPQYNVLRILRGARKEAMANSVIAQRMLARDSDLTRLLGRLAARGLLRRRRDAGDRRVITAADVGAQHRVGARREPGRALSWRAEWTTWPASPAPCLT